MLEVFRWEHRVCLVAFVWIYERNRRVKSRIKNDATRKERADIEPFRKVRAIWAHGLLKSRPSRVLACVIPVSYKRES